MKDDPGVTIVTQYFHPDESATGQLLTDLAVELEKLGCDVSVVTGFPSYWGEEKEITENEELENVEVKRVFNTQLDSKERLGSIVNGLSFYLSAFKKLLGSRSEKPLLIVTNPPFLPYIGYFVKKLKDRKYMVIVHDVHPDSAVTIGFMKDGLFADIWRWFNKRMYGGASKLVSLGCKMTDILEEKLPKDDDPDKIVEIPNWADGEFLRPIDKEDNWFAEEHGLRNEFVVLYSGNLGWTHDLDTLIEAAEYLEGEDIRFLFIGDGAQKESLVKKVDEKDLDNVTFLPFQPIENLPYSLTAGDVTVISTKKEAEGLCVSSKLYPSLAVGKPVLALASEDSEVGKVVEEGECGVRIEQRDYKKVAERLKGLRDNPELREEMGGKARELFENNYTKEHSAKKYFEMIKEVR